MKSVGKFIQNIPSYFPLLASANRSVYLFVRMIRKETSALRWFLLLLYTLTAVIGFRIINYMGWLPTGSIGVSFLLEETMGISFSASYFLNFVLLISAYKTGKKLGFISRTVYVIMLTILFVNFIPTIRMPSMFILYVVGFAGIIFVIVFSYKKMRKILENRNETILIKFICILDMVVLGPVTIIFMILHGEIFPFIVINLSGFIIGASIARIILLDSSTGGTHSGADALVAFIYKRANETDKNPTMAMIFEKLKLSTMEFMRLIDFIILATIFFVTFFTTGSITNAIERSVFSLILVIGYGIFAEATLKASLISTTNALPFPQGWVRRKVKHSDSLNIFNTFAVSFVYRRSYKIIFSNHHFSKLNIPIWKKGQIRFLPNKRENDLHMQKFNIINHLSYKNPYIYFPLYKRRMNM